MFPLFSLSRKGRSFDQTRLDVLGMEVERKWKESVFPLVMRASLPEVMRPLPQVPTTFTGLQDAMSLDMAKVTCAYKQ